jgi:hypothetical protein
MLGKVVEVGHEHPGAGIQGVDDHLAVHRAGDLHPAVLQVGGDRGDLPVAVADGLGLRQEVRLLAGVEALLALLTAGQQLQPAGVEAGVQFAEEGQGLGRQHLGGAAGGGALDFSARSDGDGHVRDPWGGLGGELGGRTPGRIGVRPAASAYQKKDPPEAEAWSGPGETTGARGPQTQAGSTNCSAAIE